MALLQPELPKQREPLWLEHPYEDAGGEQKPGGGRMAIFDATRLFPRKFKPKPVSAEEQRECKQPLTPKELLMVTGGPKTIDFGTISVFFVPVMTSLSFASSDFFSFSGALERLNRPGALPLFCASPSSESELDIALPDNT